MRHLASALLLGLLACSGGTDDTDIPDSDPRCPTPEADSCMTEELYQDCLEVAATCDGDIAIAESCPYGGFSCT